MPSDPSIGSNGDSVPDIDTSKQHWEAFAQDFRARIDRFDPDQAPIFVVRDLAEDGHELERAARKPFFGAVAVRHGSTTEFFYIGHYSDPGGNDRPSIASWASERSKRFFRSRTVDPALTLKRDYTINGERLESFIDVYRRTGDGQTHGDFEESHLRSVETAVATRTGSELGDVVPTLTEDQYDAVSGSAGTDVIITGPAGSGKSSVAFTRLAYLASPERGERRLSMDAVLVLSPSPTYGRYAASIFADLGVRQPRFLTFRKWVQGAVLTRRQRLDATAWREPRPKRLASDPRLFGAYVWAGQFAGSEQQAELLHEVVEGIWETETNHLATGPVSVEVPGEASPKELKLQDELPLLSGILPLQRRRRVLLDAAERHLRRTVSNYRMRRDDLERRLGLAHNLPSGMRVAVAMGAATGRKITGSTLDPHTMAVAHYMEVLIRGPRATFKHIVVDEAQELLPIQVMTLKHYLEPGGRLTLVGDPAQAIFLHRSSASWRQLEAVLESDHEVVHLQLPHRLTRPISQLVSHLRDGLVPEEPPLVPSSRAGLPPVLHVTATRREASARLIEIIEMMTARRVGDVAVLTATRKEAKALGKALARRRGIDVKVLPIEASHGLEFGGVVVFDVSAKNYPIGQPLPKRLLHLAVSRALHELAFISIGEPTELLEGVPEGLLVSAGHLA